jgi:hypothetical protein
MKGIYKNSTRNQSVEVLRLNGTMTSYQVISGNENNSIRQFVCAEERFKRLYIKQK